MLASSPLSAMSVKSARYASVSARASGGIVVVLAEQVQDDGDAVLVARSGVFDGFRGALARDEPSRDGRNHTFHSRR